MPDESEQTHELPVQDMLDALQQFKDSFQHEKAPFPFITNGLFGYFGYPAVQSFEDITLHAPVPARESDSGRRFYGVSLRTGDQPL